MSLKVSHPCSGGGGATATSAFPREQLGCTRFLMSDGLFIAKTLNRTLVEFPVANARIAGADSDLGFGAYWDFDSLCR